MRRNSRGRPARTALDSATPRIADIIRSDGAARSAKLCFAAFLALWTMLAIAPRYRADWLLENLPVLVAVVLLVRNYRRWQFSASAYTSLCVFLSLHSVGAHYTYSEVPYDTWLEFLFGFTFSGDLGLERNHYDRLVHLGYGLLISIPAVELLDRRAPQQGMWRWVLPVLFVISHSVIYELIEWAAALVFGGDLGVAYLGTQGDPWDAQQDMFLAAVGATLSVSIHRWRHARAPLP